MTQSDVQKFTRGLYRFLKNDGTKIRLKKLRVYRGFIDYDSSTEEADVKLDYRDQLVPTLLHEYLHFAHPTWPEEKVLRMEEVVINKLTPRQIRNIIKRLADSL